MTTGTVTYRPGQKPGRGGFRQLLHAELTKFRTVRGWVVAVVVAALLIVVFALLAGVSSVRHDQPSVPVGPGGEPVTDSFYFVHRPLAGDGSVTVAVSALEDAIASDPGSFRPGTVPWAKAGLIVKDGTRPGSPYAAIMVTSGHGVRMQDNFVHDRAGLSGPVSAASPRWLRLVRSGDTVTGYDSADGTHWSAVGTAHLAGLGSTVQGGLFVAAPDSVRGLGTVPSTATATFGDLRAHGGWTGGRWTGDQVGSSSETMPGSVTEADGRFTVTGTGDIAPAVRGSLGGAGVVADVLFGTFPALIVVIVVGTLFVTAEHRRGLIRTTLAAVPGRTRVLAAKAVVLSTVSFLAGLSGSVVAVPLGERLARANGVYLFPVSAATQLRVEVGTAALLAAASVLALAVGTIFRHSATAVTAATAAIVLPYLLVQNPFLPAGAADWLTRLTPAAAFSVQQTLVQYHQVDSVYTPYNGYYPVSPWGGLVVLAGYAALTLAVAAVLQRRRDA